MNSGSSQYVNASSRESFVPRNMFSSRGAMGLPTAGRAGLPPDCEQARHDGDAVVEDA